MGETKTEEKADIDDDFYDDVFEAEENIADDNQSLVDNVKDILIRYQDSVKQWYSENRHELIGAGKTTATIDDITYDGDGEVTLTFSRNEYCWSETLKMPVGNVKEPASAQRYPILALVNYLSIDLSELPKSVGENVPCRVSTSRDTAIIPKKEPIKKFLFACFRIQQTLRMSRFYNREPDLTVFGAIITIVLLLLSFVFVAESLASPTVMSLSKTTISVVLLFLFVAPVDNREKSIIQELA